MPQNEQPRQLLITIALPYANGQIHLGHLLEAIQADIWRRFHKLSGHRCLFICATDAHGTPVMLQAEKRQMTPEALVKEAQHTHATDFRSFHVEFDHFHTTHSEENEQLLLDIYSRLQANGDIVTKEIEQAYDAEKNIFLADRYIKGECPRCHTPEQYGDNCEVCGATYSPVDLINPVSTLSGTRPINKRSVHYFFELQRYRDFLHGWIDSGHLQAQVANKLSEWFDAGLQPWDISRDAPYFGFKIPDTSDKYFYVWLDAPIGYMASFKHYCQQHPDIKFDDYWQPSPDTELYHFVGKDIVYFHTLFWPAILKGANYRLPTGIFVHGFLTVNGAKMSKSRGTFITAQHYLKTLPAEYLRYYFAAKLNAQIEDIDLNFEDFKLRINSDLIGKYINLASRCSGFIHKYGEGRLAKTLANPDLFRDFIDAGEVIADCYRHLQYNRAIREIMQLADRANQYIDQEKPWALAKIPGNAAKVVAICTQGLNLFKLLTTYLQPILPETAEKVTAFLQCPPLSWTHRDTPLLDHAIAPYTPLLFRVEDDALAPFSQTGSQPKSGIPNQ